MKHMRLGAKMALGFGLLILVAASLGSLGVWNMKTVERENTILATEHIPEMDFAMELRAASNRVMYEMKSYGLTEQSGYFENAKKELAAVDKALAGARALQAKSPHLVGLKAQIEQATKVIEEYKSLADQSAAITVTMASDRKRLEEATAKYMEISYAFLARQDEAFKNALKERREKMEMVTSLVDLGSTAMISNFKSQAIMDSKLMQDSIDMLDDALGLFAKLRGVTRDPDEIKRIDEAETAAKGYRKAMGDFLAEQRKGGLASLDLLDKCRKEMDMNGAMFLSNCKGFLRLQQNTLTKELTERQAAMTLVSRLVDAGNATVIATFKAQALRQPDLIKEAVENFTKLDKMFADLKALTHLEEDIKQIEHTAEVANSYKGAMVDFRDNWLSLHTLDLRLEESAQQVIGVSNRTANAGMTATGETANRAVSSLSEASRMMIMGLIAALLTGIVAALLITRSITKPVHRIIEGLNEGADQVSSASGQVSSSSQQLAHGASEQAASIEETSSSLEEMASMTKQNADNAYQADNLMKEANQVVVQANDSMAGLITSMGDISRASEETSKIIKTIDEIAFQTNLLALNAAVEAARAGEAGAGFAVVADEVRNLAMRAADAAKNTANLIEGTVKKVRDGSALVTRTNDAFGKVAESARKVGELVSEIAVASNEQAQGIEQTNKAVAEMDKVVQSNAANAEESASASEEMSAQADQMKTMVNDLVALVGRKEKRKTKSDKTAATQGTKAAFRQDHHSPLPPANRNRGKESDAQAARSKAHPPSGPEENPEQAIPLDEEDFKDF